MADNLKSKVVKGTFWALMERLSGQVLLFGVGIILARLLSPTDYGTVALLTIFTSIAGVLADSGFGDALIQKKDATELDYNSVFYLSLALTSVLYSVLFFVAPWVARFYGMPELKLILRVTSVTLFFNAVNSIQNAELRRKLLFHLSFRISIISTVISAIVGVSLAFGGYGVWALVWMGVASGVSGVITRWFFIAWRPGLMFSFAALKPLWHYGWKMAVSGLLDTGFNNLYGLIIGKCYTRADLSFVNKGRHLPELLMNNVNGTVGRVALPVLAKFQDDRIRLRESMRKMMLVSTFIVFPLMTFCALVSENTILLLYGEKWSPAAPYAMVACFTFALWPFHTINLQGMQALGRSDIFLKLEVVKKIISIVVLTLFLSQSVFLWCLVAAFVSSPLSVVINSWPNRKLLGYTLWMQLSDVAPTFLVCIVMAIPILLLNSIDCSSQVARFVVLVVQAFSGFGVFLLVAFICRLSALIELLNCIGPLVSKKFPFALSNIAKYLNGK